MLCVSVIIDLVPAAIRDTDQVSYQSFFVTVDVVVAINGVWILVETYQLNSKIFNRNLQYCAKVTSPSYLDILPLRSQTFLSF